MPKEKEVYDKDQIKIIGVDLAKGPDYTIVTCSRCGTPATEIIQHANGTQTCPGCRPKGTEFNIGE